MKKFLILALAVCLAFLPMLTAKGEVARAEQAQSQITATEVDALTKKICLELKDRTTFTDACRSVAYAIASIEQSGGSQGGVEAVALSTQAEYLSTEYLDTEVEEYTIVTTSQQGYSYVEKELASYYVIAKSKSFDQSKKTILFTTNFANHYSSNDAFYGVQAEGALGTAATTAMAITLANYLASVDNAPYNYVFAFFSGTDEGNFASEHFAKNHLTRDVMLVVNMERLGCGDTYFYTDEAKTAHGEYIANIADSFGAKQFPIAGRALLQIVTVDGLPYSHQAILGDIAPFLSVEKSCLQVMGGEYSGSSLSEGGEKDIVNTKLDTYENLLKYHPSYADKISKSCEMLISLALDAQLSDVCQGAATSYKTFTKSWIAYVICIGLILVMIFVLILVASRLENKYPLPAQKKVKIAVFGKEFEDINSGDIIVDIKRDKNNDVNPFDV